MDDTLNESRQLDILFENMLRQRTFLNPTVEAIPDYNPNDYEDENFSDVGDVPNNSTVNTGGTEEKLTDDQWKGTFNIV